MTGGARQGAFDEVADSFMHHMRSGERPSVNDYASRYPELANEIRETLPALVMLQQVEDDLRHVAEEARSDTAVVDWQRQLGDFRIVREVGRGGMGVVYEAEQVSLGRRVALKVLPRQRLAGEKQRKRFEREAKAAARLHHTNIVPVFGVGHQDGLHYYVMQFIDGWGLDEIIVELRRMLRERDGGRTPTEADGADELRSDSRGLGAAGPSAAGVARSLLTGRLTRAEFGSDGTDRQKPSSASRGAGIGSRESRISGHHVGGSRDSHAVPVPAMDAAMGRFSATWQGPGSFGLPGQRRKHPSCSPRKAYWESVARIGLQAAEALQYAHDQGIIHRDVKPANLLLDTRACVWVTDFGLAKAADQPDLTHTGDVLGTIRYMAPEQFDGRADARSDICSLGLTLYELLALEPAFDEADRRKLIKQVTDGGPARLRTLDPHIPKDLETIVHKAVDREPSHRYRSAEELAADLRRYLGGEPIRARWVSPITRFHRWCRRNKSGALAVVLLLLIVGISTGAAVLFAHERSKTEKALAKSRSTSLKLEVQNLALERERQRSEENHRRAREAVDRLLTKVAMDLADEPYMEQIRRALLEDALEFYQTFLQQRADDPIIRFETALAQLRVADIQRMLSRGLESLQNYNEAMAIFESLHKEFPQRTEYREHIAHCNLRRGTALARMYRYDDATAAYRRAIAEWQELCEARPHEPSYLEELARGNNELATVWRKRYFHTRSSQYVEHANQALTKLADQFPNYSVDPDLLVGVPDPLRSTATDRGVVPEAIRNEQAQNYSSLPHDLPTLRTYEHQCRTVAKHWEQLAESHPAVPDYRKQFHQSMIQLADVLLALEHFEEVEDIYRQMREQILALVVDYPDIPEYRVGLVWNEFKLGLLLHFTGRREEAVESFRVAIDTAGELVEQYPEEPRHQIHLGSILVYCPDSQLRDAERAIAVLQRALQLAPTPWEWTTLGFAQMRAGRIEEALASYQTARQLGSSGVQQDCGEAFVFHFLNRPEDAIASYQRAVNRLDKSRNRLWYHLECRFVRAELEQLLETGDVADSLP